MPSVHATNNSLYVIWHKCYSKVSRDVSWEVEYTDEFNTWWDGLTRGEREALYAAVRLLEMRGPHLPFPYSSGVLGSKFTHMRELRIQYRGVPYRVLYAFDPRRVALLLIGGNKAGKTRWYKQFIPIADRLYAQHLVTLKRKAIH